MSGPSYKAGPAFGHGHVSHLDAGDSIEHAARQQIADLAEICAQPAGRRFLKTLLLESAALFQPVHVADDPGGRTAAYVDGRRSIGLEIIQMCDLIGPHVFPTILSEEVTQHDG